MTKTKIERVEVPIKCELPEIPKPKYLIPSENDNHYEILRKLLYNYSECRKYSENLERLMEICK